MVYLVSIKYFRVYCSSYELVSNNIKLLFGFTMEVPVPIQTRNVPNRTRTEVFSIRTGSNILVPKDPNPKEPIRTRIEYPNAQD